VLHLAGDAFFSFILGDIEVVLALEADPEFCGRADIAGKSEGQLCADAAPSTDKQMHGGLGHPQAPGNR